MALRGPLVIDLALAVSPPLDPTADQARRLVEEELAKPGYTAQPSLWERFQEWLEHLLGRSGGGVGLPAWTVPVVVLLVLAVLAFVAYRILRRDPTIASRGGPGAVLDGRGASADELRSRAERALARGDAATGVLEAYRAVVTRAIERALLDDLPGRTAHEAARELLPHFPQEGAGLRAGAAEFDAVRYGGRATTEPRAREILDLDRRLGATRPASSLAEGQLASAAFDEARP